MTFQRGFTMFEVVLSAAFVLVLIQIISVFGVRAIFLQEVDEAREQLRSELVYSRDQAMANTASSTWGVAVDGNTLYQFKGSDYATRDPEFDKVYEYGNTLQFSGDSEIVFEPPFGDVRATGTIIISNGVTHATATVNPYGMIYIE
ncbi:hypothetical protein GF380_02880 [Candidatus Uhrbacteria bacterium]|nr:hypothetical protein [Candidatus Uhrbacteria bacterium]MBD3284094.1 hypothetical protein [Candidatus Uhrbacteria bacterium]